MAERTFSADELARVLGGQVDGAGDRLLEGAATLADAGPRHVSFLSNPRYLRAARRSAAGAILAAAGVELPGRTVIRVADPYHAFARTLEWLHPAPESAPAGVHPTAVVEPDVELGDGVSVGPHVSVGAGCRLGAGVRLEAGVRLGEGVEIGARSVLLYNVSVYPGTRLGERVRVHAGSVLGSDGFGYATHDGVHHKIPQIGRLVIEDDVEIGANVCVDRGALGDTTIGRGTKIDNLVQLGHNVTVGAGCLIVAQAGVAGSTQLGDAVVLGGQAGVVGHVRLGSGARVAARSVVTRDLEGGALVAGFPAEPMSRWRRVRASVRNLPELFRRVARLEATLKER